MIWMVSIKFYYKLIKLLEGLEVVEFEKMSMVILINLIDKNWIYKIFNNNDTTEMFWSLHGFFPNIFLLSFFNLEKYFAFFIFSMF